MAALSVRSVRSGDELDRVELVDRKLSYDTGTAQSIFEGRRRARPGIVLTDAELFAYFGDWSNGYIQVVALE